MLTAMRGILLFTLLPLCLLLAALAAAIAFGGPGQPAPMASINDPFRSVETGDLPALQRFPARDVTPLGFRSYWPAQRPPRGSVVLVHGSSADSRSLHLLASALAEAGFAAHALDMRGHGGSGTKGQIAYIGQLDDDVEDFLRALQPQRPLTLAGFSAGGGFALRFAASERQHLFDHYLLLAPFISQDAPTYRADSGGWVSVGVPRIVGLSLLNAVGVQAFNHLPVMRFALNDTAKPMLTPQYSFALAQNFRPQPDWRASIRAAAQPMALLAGLDDEAFHADRFAASFENEGRPIPVTLLPGVGHIGLTLEPAAVAAVVAAVDRLHRQP
jgi:alpha-beta hydrolase superfamily lysophospholipase